jgi:hypothetical protein
MDATQMLIIKQSCLNRATDLYSKTDSWSEEQILETADIFVSWVTGKESVNVKQSLPKKPEDQKTWLNFNTPDYNQALSWIKEGYSVKDIRNQYKVAKKVADELERV